jgi:hypothetical protein
MTDFELALDALRASMPPPRHPPRPRGLDARIITWRRLMARGIAPGSQCRPAVSARQALLDAGLWREVYR